MINILDTPEDFQPVYSDGLFFTISADTEDKYKFRYVYDLYVEDTLVFQGKSTPNPYGLGVIDLSRIVKTYTENNPISYYNTTPIYTHQTFPFSRPSLKETINYRVLFGYEYSDTPNGSITGFTGTGEIGAPGFPSDLFKTFYSTMGVNGRATQQDFNISPFVLSGSPVGTNPTTSGLFLTNSPRIRDIQSDEYYTLGFTNYYLNSGSLLSQPYYVEYKFYDDQGALLDTQRFQNILTNGGGPLPDCSWVYQSYYNNTPTGNTEWNTLYVGAGPKNLENIMPANTVQYTVQLFGNFTGTTAPPTPTPSATPTPTPTPGCSTCYEYQITNPSPSDAANVYYTECANGPVRFITVGPNQTTIIECACANSLIYEAYLEVTVLSICGNLTPTPTPTLTPTPTSCSCTSYTITNTGEESLLTVNYVDCNYVSQVLYIAPGLGQSFCACSGSVNATGSTYDLVNYGECLSPTPTPTPSPTTTYCAPKEWTVSECTSPCSGGICTCTESFLVSVWTDCTVTDITDPGTALYASSALTTPYTGDFQYGSNIYNSTGSDVVLVCPIGGPC